MVLVNLAGANAFTTVVVEFFSGRCLRLVVPYPIEFVIESLRQPPSLKNTIRLEIIKRVTCRPFDHVDLIKRISTEGAFVDYYTAESNIMASTGILPSWNTLQECSQSCSDSGDECYTTRSETSHATDEYSSDDEQPLVENTPSSRRSSVDTARDTMGWPIIPRDETRLKKSLPYCFIGAILYALWPLLQIDTATTDEHDSKRWNSVMSSSFYQGVHLMAEPTIYVCWLLSVHQIRKSLSQKVAEDAREDDFKLTDSRRFIATYGRLLLLFQCCLCTFLAFMVVIPLSTNVLYYIALSMFTCNLHGKLWQAVLEILGFDVPTLIKPTYLTICFPDVKQRLTIMGALCGFRMALSDITSHYSTHPDLFDFEPLYDIYYACAKHIWVKACTYALSVFLLCVIWQGLKKEGVRNTKIKKGGRGFSEARTREKGEE